MNSVSVPNRVNGGLRLRVMPNMIALIAIIAIGIIPALNKNIVNAVRLVFFFLWLFSLGFAGNISLKKTELGIVKWWSIFLFLQILYSLLGVSTDVLFFVGKAHIYFIPIAMVVVVKYYSLREMKILWMATLIIFSVCLFQNVIIGLREGSDVFLDVAKESNVGKTAFVAICQFMITTFWIVFKCSSNKKSRMISLFLLILATYHMIFQNNRAAYTLTLIFVFVGMILISMPKEKIRLRTIVIGSVVISLFMYPLLSSFLHTLSSTFSEVGRLSSRLDDLSVFTSNGNIEDYCCPIKIGID